MPWLLGLLLAAAVPAARALDLGGRTVFSRAPWRVDLVSYTTTTGQPWAEYYFSLELPADAGAALAGLMIEQTRGVDRTFPFQVERTRAFLGRPRREGPALPVQASFDEAARRFMIRFLQPVAPGSTVTVVLKPWTNPAQSDTYMFQVSATPEGPAPAVSPVGFATLRIYDPDWR